MTGKQGRGSGIRAVAAVPCAAARWLLNGANPACGAGLALLTAVWLAPGLALAQAAPAGSVSKAQAAAPKPVKPPAQPAKSAASAASAAAGIGAAAAPAAPAILAGPGYRLAPLPAWVQPVPVPVPDNAQAWQPVGGGARRELLNDTQQQFAEGTPQLFQRLRSVATDAQALGGVSQVQIAFNPAFQTVLLHEASVWREGRKLDRLKDARHELVRREQRLEQQVIDGVQTLLLVLSDVRVGEPVDLAYTLVGQNPIYEGKLTGGYTVASDVPVDVLHLRIESPVDRPLNQRTMVDAFSVEQFTERGRQVLRVLRQRVPAVLQEQGTPPWFKVFPALMVSEYRDWAEVDAWAQRLFAAPAQPAASIAAQAQQLRATGLTGEALVDETLRFVQDEVRYFSVSLGESSHRPKPAERTLAERLGDCKDKVVLLNALLQALGFDARPALVSMHRNRGLAQFLPSHVMFDHVVTRLELNGQVRYLDGTMSGQGRGLANRGYLPYGLALVVGQTVGQGAALQVAMPPADAVNTLQFEQRWDLRQPGQPAKLEVTLRARGLAAEGLRYSLAQGGAQRLAESLGGAHARVMPGLKPVGEHQVQDDRQANVVSLRQSFEHPDPGQYERGGLDMEFTAIELMDILTGPAETSRRSPYLLDQVRVADSRIEVLPPQKLTSRPPAPLEVADRHFRFTSRVTVEPDRAVFERRFERRSDEVLPADLAGFRENLLKARQASGTRMRLTLFATEGLEAEFERIDRRLRAARGARQDALQGILVRNEVSRLLAGKALANIQAGSPLAARTLADRAQATNLLGDFAASLADADAALAIQPDLEAALEARGVALSGLGRLDDALPAIAAWSQRSNGMPARQWAGNVQVLLQQGAAAEPALREVVANGGGEEREFALLWLYLAAEQQGRGREAIASHVGQADGKKLTGALLQFLDGRIDRDAVLKLASEKPDMERLNLAEAWFFIGQQHLLRGQKDEALRAMRRVLDTGALPFREYSFAKWLADQLAGR